METDRLRYFSVIAKTENMRRAAELLSITPSALSKSVAQLEEEFGVKLITPLGRGITLTKEGLNLAKRTEPLLDSIDALKKDIESSFLEKKQAPLRLATFEVFSTYFLRNLSRIGFTDRGLILHDVIPGELEQVIEQQRADFGITYLPIPHPGIEHVKITSILMGVFKRKGSFQTCKQEDLPFVIPTFPLNGVPTKVKGIDGWPDSAYRRKIKYEVTLLESALSLCRQGLCVGYFPSFVVAEYNQLVKSEYALERHPFESTAKRCYADVYLVKRKGSTEDQTMRLLAKMIRIGTKIDRADL